MLPSEATWTDLEGIMLSEISQRKLTTVWYQFYMKSKKKYNELVRIIKKKQTHRHREQSSDYQWGEGSSGVGNWEAQSITYKISYKDTLDNTGIINNTL